MISLIPLSLTNIYFISKQLTNNEAQYPWHACDIMKKIQMEHSILKIEASAGSGKTYRLALEYIGRLLQIFAELDKKPKNFKGRQKALGSILAITFTVMAAQEMKDRIVKNLKSFALSTTGRQMKTADREFLEELSRQTGLDENKIIAISGQLIETILASYDDFKKDIRNRSLIGRSLIGSFWKILLSA